ncbi:DUF4238 domain-containing protein [Sorangium cellulosum]|uniref:DUF4238 domain-containing protein n=1 Tax=Sorangium cellulosum TaxID=56 RepID=UPI0009B679A6|nr:DUF4238 domain-containing protein [Sorangium cellulosum]
MSVPRRHHLVPRFFLKRFAKSDKIAMVNRDAPQQVPHTVTTKNAAIESGFYTIIDKNGQPSAVIENYLSDLEANAAAAIHRMDTCDGFPPTWNDRESVSRFLAFQTVRGSNMRASLQQLFSHGAQMAIDDAESDSAREQLRVELGQLSQNFIRLRHMQIMIKNANDFARFFLGRTWRIVDFGRSCLLTSDVPLAPANRTDGPVGIDNAEWLLFPLDPVRALVLGKNDGAETIVAGNQETADYINHYVAAQAHRWIYHRPQQSPLDRMELPPREPAIISRAGEGERLFHRRDAVINVKDSIVYTPFPLKRIAVTNKVIATLGGFIYL